MKKDINIKDAIGAFIKKPENNKSAMVDNTDDSNNREAIKFLQDQVGCLNKDYAKDPFTPKARYENLSTSVKSYIEMMRECVSRMNEYNDTHQNSSRIDMQNDLITTMLNNNGASIIASFKNITTSAIREAYQYYFMLVLQNSYVIFTQILLNDPSYIPQFQRFDYVFSLSDNDCNVNYSGSSLMIFDIPNSEDYVLRNMVEGFINADPGYDDNLDSDTMSTPRQCAYNLLFNYVLGQLYSISINTFMSKCITLMTYGGALTRILRTRDICEHVDPNISYADIVDRFMSIVDLQIKAFYVGFSSNMMEVFNILGNASKCVFPGYVLTPYISPAGNVRSDIVSKIDCVPRDYTMEAVVINDHNKND